MGRPFRPCPDDFDEVHQQFGWGGGPDHYGTNGRVYARWLRTRGLDEMRQQRRNFVLGRRIGNTARIVDAAEFRH